LRKSWLGWLRKSGECVTVRIRWLGHAGFEIGLEGRVVLVDPWLKENPKAPCKPSDLEKVDLVCVSHDHPDHLGDSIEICKRTGAVFLSTYELASYAGEQGVERTAGMNIGGTYEGLEGITVTLVQAFHTAGKGVPVGFIIRGEGKTVYHAGDTGLFGDMSLIGEIYGVDVALLPIGDYYTMGALEAAEAVRLLKPKTVIPMHYQTLPELAQTPQEFIQQARKRAPEVEIAVLKPGETLQIPEETF